ncbi:MAG: hypothetical protein LBS74_04030 [Oscillospiraceae bacterium]|jgi:hypothetical protein|nr:hypothetical protein [Oscillospiraceae bacterium]
MRDTEYKSRRISFAAVLLILLSLAGAVITIIQLSSYLKGADIQGESSFFENLISSFKQSGQKPTVLEFFDSVAPLSFLGYVFRSFFNGAFQLLFGAAGFFSSTSYYWGLVIFVLLPYLIELIWDSLTAFSLLRRRRLRPHITLAYYVLPIIFIGLSIVLDSASLKELSIVVPMLILYILKLLALLIGISGVGREKRR